MTYLEQNKAIYAKMCEIADDVFGVLYKGSETLRERMESQPSLTNGEFVKCNRYCPSLLEQAHCETDDESLEEQVTVQVENYKCSFKRINVFDSLKPWMKLAKAKDHVYTVAEHEGEPSVVFSMSPDNLCSAKKLSALVGKEPLYPPLTCVRVEYDKATSTVSFVATDSHILGVVTNGKEGVAANTGEKLSALIDAADWKKVCNAMRDTKQDALFKFYEGDGRDSLTVTVGDAAVKSRNDLDKYPSWRRVIPDKNAMRHYVIAPEDRKNAQKWLSRLKKQDKGDYVSVSVYEGSDRIYFDLCQSVDEYWDREKMETVRQYERRSVSFRMTDRADRTEGIAFAVDIANRMPMNGIHIEGMWRPTLIDCDDLDVLLACPVCRKEEEVVFDTEQRAAVMAMAV